MFPLKRGQTSLKTSRPKHRETHTQFTTHGMGDYYGSGAKNPIGRVRDGTVGFRPVTKKQMGTKSRSVV